MKPVLTLREEITSVYQYLESESLSLNGKLTREFYLDPEVDDQIPVPRNLIMAFVENTVRNGLKDESGDKTLSISVHKSAMGVLIMVADSGMTTGNGAPADFSQSEGLKFLNSYLPVFNRQYGMSISFKVLQLTSENGTPGARAMITIRDQ